MSKKKKKIHKPEEIKADVENPETAVEETAVASADPSDVTEAVPAVEAVDDATESVSDTADQVAASDGDLSADAPDADMAEDTTVKVKKPRTVSQAPRLVMILTAICVVVALLLGVVNAVTKEKIADNAARAKEIAILSIFKDGNRAELYDIIDGKEVYLVYRNEGLVGYCVFLTVTGFGGDIDMTVGINGEISTCGVKIVNMSETPGVGTKVKTPDFLELFDGLSHEDPIGDVDAISGATISSGAVMSGVKAAHEIDFDFKAVAEKLGVKILTPADILDIKETETETTPSPESESDGTASGAEPAPTESRDPSESDPAEETEDIPYVDNGGEKYYIYGVGVTTVDDRYVLEIKKEDETATFEKETKEPETEKETEKATEKQTEKPTEAPTTAETTTKAETTVPPTTAQTTTEPQTTASPETSDTSAEDTSGPAESTETTGPVSPDTSDTADTGDPLEVDTTGGANAVSEPEEITDSSSDIDSQA